MNLHLLILLLFSIRFFPSPLCLKKSPSCCTTAIEVNISKAPADCTVHSTLPLSFPPSCKSLLNSSISILACSLCSFILMFPPIISAVLRSNAYPEENTALLVCGEQPADHRGMSMLNLSSLIHSPQRQYKEKFIKCCPLLQALAGQTG